MIVLFQRGVSSNVKHAQSNAQENQKILSGSSAKKEREFMCRCVIDVNLLLKEHPFVNHHELITSIQERRQKH